jgi:hypothetical protein
MATGDATRLFIHAINRSPQEDSELNFVLPQTWKIAASGTRFMWQASLDPKPPKVTNLAEAITQTPVTCDQSMLHVPARSVCVFQFTRIL